MAEYIEGLIIIILDSFEEFFNNLLKPTNKYIQDCLLVSLVFFIISIVTYGFNIFAFISPIESSITSFMFIVVWLVDSSNRAKVKDQVSSIKQIGLSKFKSEEEDSISDDIVEGEIEDEE